MADLKIRVFKDGGTTPATTVTIPGSDLKVASRLIPKQAAAALREKGIDLDEIVSRQIQTSTARSLKTRITRRTSGWSSLWSS